MEKLWLLHFGPISRVGPIPLLLLLLLSFLHFAILPKWIPSSSSSYLCVCGFLFPDLFSLLALVVLRSAGQRKRMKERGGIYSEIVQYTTYLEELPIGIDSIIVVIF